MENKDRVAQLCQDAKIASKSLALASEEQKNKALFAMAEHIMQHQSQIISANTQDMSLAKQKGLSGALLDRLWLDKKRIKAMAEGLKAIVKLPEPVDKILSHWQQPSGLKISKVSVPIGVIAVIYESRPNVTADAAGLCLKSGNAVILRGGSESAYSSRAILNCLKLGLEQAGLPIHAIQMLPSQSRNMVRELIQQDQYVDVIVPRGGKTLIKALTEKSRIPLFKHLEGLCHTYIHQDALVEKAVNIVLNAKMRRTGICGATETLLIDRKVIKSHFPKIVEALLDAGCEVRLDQILKGHYPSLPTATVEDWSTEYLDGIISVKVVENLEEALAHINQYSSQHTDAIVTENDDVVARFLTEVDSAIVMHNTSTQFADGGEFGMGAEIGISTGKLHARGPVGVEQLTTFKYQVRSEGAVRPA
jgi:glutamate-5-semialdehyde dehydrogenase